MPRPNLTKYASHIAMVRLVRDLIDMIDDGVRLSESDRIHADNVLYAFLAKLPRKVTDEVLNG